MGGLSLKSNILLARTSKTDLADLVTNIDISLTVPFKEVYNVIETESIQLNKYIDLVMVGSDNILQEEKEILKVNNLIPVIIISHKSEEDLINEFNIYRSIEKIEDSEIEIIKNAIDARQFIVNSIGDRPEVFFNLEQVIKKEIKTAKSNQKTISSFEALYDILKRNKNAILVHSKKDSHEILLENLHAKVIPYLDLYERNKNKAHLTEARANFLPSLHVLRELDKAYKIGEFDKLVQFLVGGSSISEQGIRCLIGINLWKKYDINIMPPGYFLRDVHDRKGMRHDEIAQIRYDTQQDLEDIFSKNQAGERILFPRTYYPLKYENVSYLIQQPLIGPDLEYVMLKVRDSLAKQEHSVSLLKKIRESIISKYLDDLVSWQKNTQKAFDKDDSRLNKNPKEIAEYFKTNLIKVPCQYQKEKLIQFTEKELKLWNNCLDYLTPHVLGILKSSIVLSMDASSKNAILHIGRKFPSMAELIDALTSKNPNNTKSFSRDKLDRAFYHVDPGFVSTHFLEDFYHIVDAYENVDADLSKKQILNHRQKWYDYYCDKSEIKQMPIMLDWVGAYRNMRRAFLVVKEFQQKNESLARDKRISEHNYSNFKRSYEQMNEHHMTRSVIYLDELKNQFTQFVESMDDSFPEFKSRYKSIISSDEFDENKANDANKFINSLIIQSKDNNSRKKKKQIKNFLNGTASYCLARLTEKMLSVKLPSYSDATKGVLDE